MIDAMATLDPAAGLARDCVMRRVPGVPLWTVAVDVGLAESKPDVSGAPRFDRVGATGFRRADAMIRAAGEAVERYALVPRDGDPCRVCDVPADHPMRVPVGTRQAARAHPAVDQRAADCIGAVRLATGQRVLLPAAVVEDPVRDEPWDQVDPTPSAAAAGSSWSHAATNALLESVERDAVQCAWVLRPPLPALDPAAIPPAFPTDPDDPDGRDEASLADTLAAVGGSARTVLVPTDVPGVTVALTLLVDDGPAGLVGAGSSAAWNSRRAVIGSAREAVQVLMLLRGLLAQRGAAPSGSGPIVDEPSRAELWMSPRARTIARDWLSGCVPIAPGAGGAGGGGASGGEPPDDPLDHLTRHLMAARLDPILCDLGPRLPSAIRDLGWHAARSVVIGHQVLRMAETADFTWAHARIRRHAARWGVAVPPDLCVGPPHPLI